MGRKNEAGWLAAYPCISDELDSVLLVPGAHGPLPVDLHTLDDVISVEIVDAGREVGQPIGVRDQGGEGDVLDGRTSQAYQQPQIGICRLQFLQVGVDIWKQEQTGKKMKNVRLDRHTYVHDRVT